MDWIEETYDGRIRYALRVERRIAERVSALQHIEIVETRAFGRTLLLDGVFMTSEGEEHFYHEMLVHPPLTTAPHIRRVLIVGGGDGGTAREVLRHPGVERVVLVEIDGDVIAMCREHLPSLGAWDDPRLEVVVGDGVAYVADAPRDSFDVVLLDGIDPVGPGEALFGPAFYRSVSTLLGETGVFALQSASPIVMQEVYRRVQHGLHAAFAVVHPYFGPAPIYAGGQWSWTWASQNGHPFRPLPERAAAVESGCRYWNRQIHGASFARSNALR